MSRPRAPRAVLFDMDGLLFDTESLYLRAFADAASSAGLAVPDEVLRLTIGMPWVRCRGLMIDALGERFPIDDFYERMTARFVELSAAHLRLKPGVLELLDALDDLAVPRCIVTSSAHATVRRHLAAHDLDRRFDAVIAHGDSALSKPAPDPYLVAAARLGVAAADCWALEDSPHGVQSASAAGAVTIMVPDLVQPTDDIRAACHHVVESLRDVARLARACRPS